MIFSFLGRGSGSRIRAGFFGNAEPLVFPLRDPQRVAVLAPGFRAARNTREFRPEDAEALVRFAPESIVAPLELALSFADRKHSGVLDLPSVVSMIIVTSLDGPMLTARHRDYLWSAFGIPLFEQMRAPGGAVIARECEVHDGLHLDDKAFGIELGHVGQIERSHCECGAETPRLRKTPPALASALV